MRMEEGFLLETHNKGAKLKKTFPFPLTKILTLRLHYTQPGQRSNSTIKYVKEEHF
jgi:hypothetical protein